MFLPFEALFCSCQNLLFGTTANALIAVLGFVQIVLCYIPTPSQDDSEPVSKNLFRSTGHFVSVVGNLRTTFDQEMAVHALWKSQHYHPRNRGSIDICTVLQLYLFRTLNSV